MLWLELGQVWGWSMGKGYRVNKGERNDLATICKLNLDSALVFFCPRSVYTLS